MLDAETKARIDSARDILVGKVPDPKSQVEQITIALIYKFMDDMDRQSEELGGVATFFSGEFKKYTWSRLLDMSLGGHERLTLYADGISVMDRNPNIPQLFRDIFKGAFLPYRDPETLNLFLKEINGFTYEHSERLGDAFEYLLSVLGSQGEAGQFRTPRHIIDFIVRIVDPQKHETILDPACGTAGFLVSAYKHILASNSDERPGDKLSGDERARLMDNFCGYDISPDMVRLSRANLYLHGFANPRIYEYDTLTSEDRWDERYDVIMANPPFMSPKGGIRPHNRFSIKARRSEVLFVDYIAEHLHVNGRAGVIVPEGIIFQSQNAYKALRKMLLESYLWCVVSLPGGVFNPYSGVKTSVLLLDKGLAKRTDEILFVKVEADGFDLGAQRRPVERDDLPEAERAIAAWRAGQPSESSLAHAVRRGRILASADVSLSGDRYRDNGLRVSAKWPMVSIGELLQPVKYTPKVQKSQFLERGRFPIIDQSEQFIAGYWNDDGAVFRPTRPVVLFGDHTRAVKYVDFDFVLGADGVKILQPDERVIPRFFYYCLANAEIPNLGYSRHFKELVRLAIPLPPLDVQRQIVAELDGYRKIIEGSRQVIANYKPTIKIDPSWPKLRIGDFCTTTSGGTPLRSRREFYDGGTIPWIKSGEVAQGLVTAAQEKITEGGLTHSSAKLLPPDTVLVAMYGATAGQVGLLKIEASTNQAICGILPNEKCAPEFMFHVLRSMTAEMVRLSTGGAQPNISQEVIRNLVIPLPALDMQRQIVAEIEMEQTLVDANRKLVELFEQKIQDKLAEIWGEAGQTT